jgi:ribonuclease HII
MPTPIPTRDVEKTLPGPVAQIDEVGRGPLCGPVCAAAVILPDLLDDELLAVRDSKRLAPRKRERLAAKIRATCDVGIGLVEVETIDRIGIQAATHLAMTRALIALGRPYGSILVDGDRLPPGAVVPGLAVVDGDALCTGIAAASIVAKVHRDGLIHQLANEFPMYGWIRNAGYGTAEHLAALKEYGHTIHHRKSFGGVKGTRPLVVPQA